MARARNIKPGFFANEELVELPFATRLLFIGLWTLADREGRLEDRPKRIKMALFPADNLDVEEALSSLAASGFLTRYEHDGERYIQVTSFAKHQNPHRDEKASTIPAPCKHSANTVQEQSKHGGNRADSLIPDSPNPSSLNPESQKAPTAGYTPEFEEAWAAYPDRPGASKKESFKAWNARIKAGAKPEDMLQGVMNYAAYVKGKKVEPEFIKQPATFFGPDEHFKSDWTFTDSPNARASPQRETIAEKNDRIMAEVLGKPVDDGMTIEMEDEHG